MSSKPRSSSRRVRATLHAALAALAAVAIALAMASPAAAVEDYVIIVSPDVPAEAMGFERVRRLFLFREKYWKPGFPVKPIISESSLEPGSFLLERIYRMDYSGLRRLIVEKLYQEEIDLAPKIVASDEVAVAFVRSGRGLFALVRAAAVRGTDAKVVAVDGLVPGAPGYALRK